MHATLLHRGCSGPYFCQAPPASPQAAKPAAARRRRRQQINKTRMPSGARAAKDQLQLVAQLVARDILQSQRTIDVMRRVDRGHFVHHLEQPHRTHPAHIYQDDPLPIGLGQTISAPSMHAICLDLLSRQLAPGAFALDVGSGSGYLTACMALLVGPTGRVVGVEKHPQLAQRSLLNIGAACPELPVNQPGGCLHIHNDNIYRGEALEAGQEYDAIHVGAAATEVPEHLVACLKPGGRMVLPVGNQGEAQVLAVVDKSAAGEVTRQDVIPVRYVPLTRPEEG